MIVYKILFINFIILLISLNGICFFYAKVLELYLPLTKNLITIINNYAAILNYYSNETLLGLTCLNFELATRYTVDGYSLIIEKLRIKQHYMSNLYLLIMLE